MTLTSSQAGTFDTLTGEEVGLGDTVVYVESDARFHFTMYPLAGVGLALVNDIKRLFVSVQDVQSPGPPGGVTGDIAISN